MQHSNWPFTAIDTSRYMTTLIFAVTLPWFFVRLSVALHDARDVARSVHARWRRWQFERRVRSRREGYRIVTGAALSPRRSSQARR